MRLLKLNAGVGSALLAGVLFGVSTPLAKRLIQDIDPWMLAGLLYLGSGIGLAVFRVLRRSLSVRAAGGSLRGADRWWLAAAVLAGGVIAPVLMMFGLARTAGSSASLLLNLEGVFTTLMAWFIFRENFDRRIALGVLSITCGALVLSFNSSIAWSNAIGPAAIAAACLAWAVDNNLTRKVALNDVIQIAMAKGLAAGTVNVVIAAAIGARWPSTNAMLGAGIVGLCGYGISLVLFVVALRHLGAARTGAYFSIAPFVGAAFAVVFLHERLTMQLLSAGMLMGTGLWLHLTERHDHDHTHRRMTHEHMHVHDSHHQHPHEHDAGAEPHSHAHAHEPLRHRHAHYPDEHHRHEHHRHEH
jgi:drug/metabolite transporter (DMT)-like permease